MAVVRTARSLNQILDLVELGDVDGAATLVLTSTHLRNDQKRMIEELARRSGESQATILRAIIDEWIELRLRER